MGCAFCGIASGDVPARVLAGTRLSVSFLDASPLARGHALVIPRAHRRLIQDLGPEECADLFWLVRETASRLEALSGSALVAVHNGPGAGQEVPHEHVHLVPRAAGDGAGPIHSMFRAPAEADLDGVLGLVGKEPLP